MALHRKLQIDSSCLDLQKFSVLRCVEPVFQCDPAKALKALFDALWAGPRYLLMLGGACPPVTALIARSLPSMGLLQVQHSRPPLRHSLLFLFHHLDCPRCPRCPSWLRPPTRPTGSGTGTYSARRRRSGR